MRIVGYGQDRGACTQLRIVGPLTKILNLKLADVEIIGPGDESIQDKVKRSDVVVMGRATGDAVCNMIDGMHSHDKYVVYDLDDNMFGVGPFSPHYKDFGIMPVDMTHPQMGTIPMWMDGQPEFNVKRNRLLRQSFIKVLRKTDCVTVTTPPLQKLYARYHDNVQIVPNAIDFGVWERIEAKHNSDNVRVLYTGASNHREDWMFVKAVLEDLQKEYPNWTLVLIGADWHNLDTTLDHRRVEFHGWVDIDAYPYLMRSLLCDIGIAPISNTPFNDCRSSIKWLEYSALKMAIVATDYGPYRRDCKDGHTAMLVKERDEWYGALSKLLEDEQARKGLGERAYRDAKARFNLDFMADTWMSVFTQKTQIKAMGG